MQPHTHYQLFKSPASLFKYITWSILFWRNLLEPSSPFLCGLVTLHSWITAVVRGHASMSSWGYRWPVSCAGSPLFLGRGAEFAPPKYACLGVLILLGWSILRNSRVGRSSEHQVEVTLCKRTFAFVRGISTCKGIPLIGPGLPSLSMEKTIDVNLYNSLPLVYCSFPGNSP